MLNKNIRDLVEYGIEAGLVPPCERIYTINLLLDLFQEDEYTEPQEQEVCSDLECILKELLDEAVKREIIQDSIGYRDLFDTKLMNCLVPRPAQVQERFWKEYDKSPETATDFFYKFSQDTDYIRRYRIKRTGDGPWKVLMEPLTLPLICLSRRRTQKPLQPPKMQSRAAILSVSFAWRTKAMQEG